MRKSPGHFVDDHDGLGDDLAAAGRVVEFLPDEVAAAFAAAGPADAARLAAALDAGVPCDLLLPHPMPELKPDGPRRR